MRRATRFVLLLLLHLVFLCHSIKPVEHSSFIISGNSWNTAKVIAEEKKEGKKIIRYGNGFPNFKYSNSSTKSIVHFATLNSAANNIYTTLQDDEKYNTENTNETIEKEFQDFYIENLIQNKFVHAESIFWFNEDNALYISDNYGGKFYRLRQTKALENSTVKTFELIDPKFSYSVNVLQLPYDVYGCVGPIIPISGSLTSSEVNVIAGFNTKLNTAIRWNIQKPSSIAFGFQDKFRFPGKQNLKNRRYQCFTFGTTDLHGRIFTASVDVRTYLKPYPCDNDLLFQELEKSNKRGVLSTLNQLKKNTSFICRAGGVAFSENSMYYVDHITKALLLFDYDSSTAETSNYRLVLELDKKGLKGSPSGLVLDTKGHLWIGFRGSGQIVELNPKNNDVLRVITVPQPDITDIAFDAFNSLYVLTRKSLYALRNIGARGVITPGYLTNTHKNIFDI